MPQRVVILAGHRRSLSTIAMTWELSQLSNSGVQVVGVVCVSEFSWSRLNQWRRRLGASLVHRILSELGLSKGGQFKEERESYLKRLQDAQVTHRNLQSLCHELNVPFKVVRDINDLSTVQHMESMDVDYAVYSGCWHSSEPLN